MTECTTVDCNNPTDEYLCGQCVQDLQAWIDQIPALLNELPATIARTDVTRSGANEGGNGTHKAGSSAPLNLDALNLKHELEAIVHASAKNYSQHQPSAALIATQIANLVTQAERIVSGPEAERPRPANELRHRLAVEVPEELPVPKLVEWLKVTHGINLKPSRIWKWAERGHITRTNAQGRAKYSPTATLIHARNEACNG